MHSTFMRRFKGAEKMFATLCQGPSLHFAILIFLGGGGEICRHLSLLVPDILSATSAKIVGHVANYPILHFCNFFESDSEILHYRHIFAVMVVLTV